MKRLVLFGILASLVFGGALGAEETAPAPTVTLNLKETPFRDAIRLLFENSRAAVNVLGGVPNPAITLNVRNVPFDTALRMMVRQASTPERPIIVAQTGDGYELRPGTPGAGALLVTQKIQLHYVDHNEMVRQLIGKATANGVMPEGVTGVVGYPLDQSIVVTGTPEGIDRLKELVRLIDVPAAVRSISINVDVVTTGAPRPLSLGSMLRVLPGTRAELNEDGALGQRPGHTHVTLKPEIQPDGSIVVESEWDISLPIPAAKGEVIRLVKHLKTTTRLEAGVTTSLATLDLNAWGGKGTVELRLRATPEPLSGGDPNNRGSIGFGAGRHPAGPARTDPKPN